MNIESMRTRPYRSFKVDGAELPAPARERLRPHEEEVREPIEVIAR